MRETQLPDLLWQSYVDDEPLVAPTTAMFDIVKRCNAGCGYCADWKNDPDPRTDPSRELISGILRGLRDLGVPRVVLAGGEPFLRRDLPEIVAETSDLGLRFGVITNGTAVTEQRAALVCARGPEFMGVSVDSLDAGRMHAIRRLPLNRVLRTVEVLRGLRERAPFVITLQVTITKLNIDDLLPLAAYAAQHELTVSYQPVHFSGSGAQDSVMRELWPDEADIARLSGIVGELVAMRRQGTTIKNREEHLGLIPEFFARRTFYPAGGCTVAYTDVVIDTEFAVRPCWSMDAVAQLSATNGLVDVWHSEAMRAVRREIRQGNCPGCLYKCHISRPHLDLPPVPETIAVPASGAGATH